MSGPERRRASALGETFRAGTRHGAERATELVELCERRDLILLLLRGKPTEAPWRERCEAALGLPLPLVPNTTSAGPDRTVLWLGPDEWLVSGCLNTSTIDALTTACTALVDISHGRSVIRLAGRHAPALLAKGLPLDLHPRSFGPGRCAQSVLARCNVLLHQLDSRPTYDLYAMRSYARSVTHFLLQAGAEYGCRVIDDA